MSEEGLWGLPFEAYDGSSLQGQRWPEVVMGLLNTNPTKFNVQQRWSYLMLQTSDTKNPEVVDVCLREIMQTQQSFCILINSKKSSTLNQQPTPFLPKLVFNNITMKHDNLRFRTTPFPLPCVLFLRIRFWRTGDHWFVIQRLRICYTALWSPRNWWSPYLNVRLLLPHFITHRFLGDRQVSPKQFAV